VEKPGMKGKGPVSYSTGLLGDKNRTWFGSFRRPLLARLASPCDSGGYGIFLPDTYEIGG